MPSNVPQPSHARRSHRHASIVRSAAVALLTVSTVLVACAPGLATSGRLAFAPVDRSESRAAHEELEQARRAYTRLSVAHVVATRRVTGNAAHARDRTAAEVAGPAVDATRVTLERNVTDAIARFENARRPLLASVRSKPDYREMAEARLDIRRAIDALITDGTGNDAALINLARRAMDLGSQMTRAELLALALDPNVEDARLAMTTSFEQLRKYTDVAHVASGMPSRFHALPAPIPTPTEVEAARARVEAADRRLADALLREAALEQVRTMRINQQRFGAPVAMFGR